MLSSVVAAEDRRGHGTINNFAALSSFSASFVSSDSQKGYELSGLVYLHSLGFGTPSLLPVPHASLRWLDNDKPTANEEVAEAMLVRNIIKVMS